jgi:hypothetical protein
MIFKDISSFNQTQDYLPILSGAILTDLIVIILAITGFISSKSLKKWYRKYGLGAIIADILIIVIVIIIARYIYPFIFSTFSIVSFIIIGVIIQVVHDISFYQLTFLIPNGKSDFMDTFQEYIQESGYPILFADASMVISTIVLSSFFSSLSYNTNIIIFIVLIYLIPYLVFSV